MQNQQKKFKKKKFLNNCEICDECLYICEGDYICDKFGMPVLVKEDWTPTEYYSNCLKCKNYNGEGGFDE